MRCYDGTSAGGLASHTFTIAVFERFRSRRIVQYVSVRRSPFAVSGALPQPLVMLSLPPAIFHHRESLLWEYNLLTLCSVRMEWISRNSPESMKVNGLIATIQGAPGKQA